MNPVRRLLLAASDNHWLRRNATRWPLLRRAVTRFMPGEALDDALGAALVLRREQRIAAIFTRLGENVATPAEADVVAAHYLEAYDRFEPDHPDAECSVKLTQLGLDVDQARCHEHVAALAARAARHGSMLWIDMEQHTCVDATLALYHDVLVRHRNVGVCLQAYLYRTADDLQAIIDAGGAVRLVKGAYREPASVAHPRRADVDASYLALARTMLGAEARAHHVRAVFGTHDVTIIEAIRQYAARTGVPQDGYEFAMLYGIQRGVQQHLARDGARVRVLISYGDYWFPWYMRRLAERPANVWFVARSLLGR